MALPSERRTANAFEGTFSTLSELDISVQPLSLDAIDETPVAEKPKVEEKPAKKPVKATTPTKVAAVEKPERGAGGLVTPSPDGCAR